MNIEKIGEHIKELRIKKNLTQEELANKLYVTNKAVSRWETGKSIPEIETLYLLAKELDTSIDDLLNCDNINDEIKSYYEKKRKKNMIIDFIVLGLIFIIPILYMINLARFEANVMFMWSNTDGLITKEKALEAVDLSYWLINKFIVRWLIMILSYIFYKWKKSKLLIVSLILTILIGFINIYPDISDFREFLIQNLDINGLCIIFSIIVIVVEIIIIKKRKDY